MTRLSLRTWLVLVVFSFLGSSLFAQSVLDPNDPVINYNPSSPPAQPPAGQIGKWIRTPRNFGWNTDVYKAYIYNGYAFRLKFPKTYNPTANDGKKYPMIVFFHGYGEIAPNTDNEFHLLHGASMFSGAVDNGVFDGYVLFMQSDGFFHGGHYQALIDIINYMISNNKLDPFDLVVNGLSSGGEATWQATINNPTYYAASLPMSWCSPDYNNPTTINNLKYTPIWLFQGGSDWNPPPSTSIAVRDAFLAAGGTFRYTEYPNVGHDTWYRAWNEEDYWPFVNAAYSSNPWALHGKFDFFPGEPINTTIGVAPGFSAYEWRKDNVVIPGATSNSLNVTQLGTYQVRVQRNGIWSDWSRIPAVIKIKNYTTLPGKIEAENYAAHFGVKTEWTQDAGGGLNVGWINLNDWMDYHVNNPSAGTYQVRLRIATPNTGAQLQIRKSDGTVLSTLTLPNTGSYQTWQTVTTNVTLPAGYQTLRIVSIASDGWNFNWMELTSGAGNLAPTANAGPDQTILLPNSSVTLNGSGTDSDGNIASYSWTKVSGPAGSSFTNASSASTTVNGLVQGTYVFRLTVTDNGGATATDDVTVTVNGGSSNYTSLPAKIEAENWTAMSGVLTENTQDAGGGLNVGWIENGDWMDYNVNVATAGTWALKLRVATPNNGAQLQVKNGNTVLSTVNLPNTIGYQSFQTITVYVALQAGQQTIRIVSSANPGWNINWLEFVQSSGNVAPVANAGNDQTIILPNNSATLNGSGTDPDGSIASYSWLKISGPAGSSFSNATSASTTVNGLVQGTYVFRLTVTDNGGATGTDDVTVTVNQAPGITGKIEAEDWAAMSGVQTEFTQDAGGGLNVGWIDNNDWMDYTVNVSTAGTYTLRLRIATPNTGAQLQVRKADGTVLRTVTLPNTGAYQAWQTYATTITLVQGVQTIRLYSTTNLGWNINWLELVQGGGNIAPVANAGPDQTITLPTNSVQLNGSGTDSDGSITSYSWSKVSGPTQGSFSSTTVANPTFSNMVQGTYVLRLTVTDNSNATATDDVTITVRATPTVPAKIEAENWSAMSGVLTEFTQDAGGGLNVGWIENGDWMDFAINAPGAGSYTLRLRIATPNNGAQLQIRRSATTLATVNLPNTGSYQGWQTVTTTVSLIAGVQTIRVISTANPGWNINWLEFATGVGGAANLSTEAQTEEIRTESKQDFDVFPNPVQDQFTLRINNAARGNMKVRIVNMNGALQKEVNINKQQELIQTNINIGNLPRGQYLLIVEMNGVRETRKLTRL